MTPNKIFKRVKAFAFTLTEVLIAVTIVGVISALVLPMLVSSYTDDAIDKGFQRETKLLEQTLSLDAAIFNDTEYKTHNESEKFINKYLKISKYCSSDNGDCFAKKYYIYQNKNKVSYYPEYTGACAALKNGMSICLSSDGAGTATILLDINGKKGPNIYGRDLRVLTISYNENSKSLITNSSPVYYDNVKITTKNKCNGEDDLSLECCKTLNIKENTGCCINSEIYNEYIDICKKQDPCTTSSSSEECCLSKTITDSNDTCCGYTSVKNANSACVKHEDISYSISCNLSLDTTAMYTVKCTVSPQKVDNLSIDLDISIVKKWKNNGQTYSNKYEQNHVITEDNLTPSKSGYMIEAGAPFNFDITDNEVITSLISINDCSLSYNGYWMDAIPDGATTCKGTLTIGD